jgi:hypothetical protein
MIPPGNASVGTEWKEQKMNFFRRVRSVVGMIVCLLVSVAAVPAAPRVEVIIGGAPPDLERFAASELCNYLAKLYGIQAHPSRSLSGAAQAVFLIGSPQTNAAVKKATGRNAFPTLTDQGLVLRRTEYEGRPALIVGGGSARATLWAVYELVERWGVRYLTDRDALPERTREFNLPNLDVVMEPVFRIRAHPTLQDFAPSGEAWGMADFRVLIDQLAKLKFSRMNVYTYMYQPYLHWEHKGIKRSSASLWYGAHFPITADMIGRELFEDASEFWNPDLPLKGSYEQLIAAGERQVHNLIEYAHRRGMECDVTAATNDFPPEFAPLLKGAARSSQMAVRPGANTPVDDPVIFELSAAILRATVNTYPEADRVTVAMPEEKQWLGEYERAWQALDAKYGIGKVRSLAEVVSAAGHRKGSGRWPGDLGIEQVKADLTSLYFYDRLLNDPATLKDTLRPDIKFVYGEPAEELFPLLDRILPSGSEVGIHPENQPEHFLPRAEILSTLNTKKVPGFMHVTLDDDVVGLVPQLRPAVLHKMIQELQRRGWTGFVTRERFPGDHDAVLAYLARAAWDQKAAPDAVTRDLIRAVCGEGSVEDLVAALNLTESATLSLATGRAEGPVAEGAVWSQRLDVPFAFYVRGMMMKFWRPRPIPAYLSSVQRDYGQALEAARRAAAKAKPEGRWYPDFWVGRLEFALGYANAVEALHRGAAAEAAKKAGEALAEAEKALALVRGAVKSYARVARNRTDLGAIAVMNEYGDRALKAKIAELKK